MSPVRIYKTFSVLKFTKINANFYSIIADAVLNTLSSCYYYLWRQFSAVFFTANNLFNCHVQAATAYHNI